MKKCLGLCWLLAAAILIAGPVFAQQAGSISGRVVATDGEGIAGVLVTATASVLPQARSTTTSTTGEFRLPLLPPGDYTVTFAADGLSTETRSVRVLLQQDTSVDLGMAPEALQETVEVIGTTLVDTNSAELKASVGSDVIDALPVGQEYRDLVKLIPGVQFTQDTVRGPSAGGSGQDNGYQFDGVNVALPLFGTLSSQPATHDIDQITVVKGGAKAVDFNRAGGFSINSMSKSGTSSFHGQLSYQLQSADFVADRDARAGIVGEEDKDWLSGSLGGPILQDRLFFFASAYVPSVEGVERFNVRNDLVPFTSDRDEYFGKLTLAPTQSLLFHGSFRTSETDETGRGATNSLDDASVSFGNDAQQDIAIVEGSWIINDRSFASIKYTDFALETTGLPDNLFSFRPALSGGRLDVGALDTQGLFTVPTPIVGATAFNEFIAPIIARYGTTVNGVRVGGGNRGGAATVDANDFFRESYQAAYDINLGINELHFGFQHTLDEEDLDRQSNGWGIVTVVGGRSLANGIPIAYTAAVLQTGLVNTSGIPIPVIHSEFEADAFEFNDNIKYGNWAFNVGLLATKDTFFGQGLREADTISGYVAARGHKYTMYEIDFEDMLQPRLGAVWAYDGSNTIYTSYARYMPAASSLPRAASWDRNLAGTVNVDFDAAGNIIRVAQEAGSSGKLFDDELDPRAVDEYMVGTSRQFSSRWTARAHARYRYGYNFWEDTDNTDRLTGTTPPGDVPRQLYIPDLALQRAQIGSGSTYVIAELDGAFTKYIEAGLEAEWRGSESYVRASYVWSHYYGNFDQDNSTTANDANVFVGSSFIGDFVGRQVWDHRYGDMRGDRRHQLKVYGFHNLPWKASVGAYAIYQSGQPWEAWDVEAYRAALTAANSSSTSSTSRFAEGAGSRTTDDHYQLDLNYTQDIPLGDTFTVQVRGDVYNVFDNQTGYNPQPVCRGFSTNGNACPATVLDFGVPRNFYDPMRFQVAVKLLF